MSNARVCLAAIVGAHGVRGLVRLKPFTEEPESVVAYGPLSDEAGERQFRLRLKGQVKGLLLAEVEGVADRDAAEALRGLRLYVARAALPPPNRPTSRRRARAGAGRDDERQREDEGGTEAHRASSCCRTGGPSR